MSFLVAESIDATTARGGFGARVHYLEGSLYRQRPFGISEATAEAATTELPLDECPGAVLWIDFSRLEAQSPRHIGQRSPIKETKLGDIAFATERAKVRQYSEVLAEFSGDTQLPTELQLLLSFYAIDTGRHPDGRRRHPIEPIYDMVRHPSLDPIDVIDTDGQQRKERYSERFARLARQALASDHDGTTTWLDSMEINPKMLETPDIVSISQPA